MSDSLCPSKLDFQAIPQQQHQFHHVILTDVLNQNGQLFNQSENVFDIFVNLFENVQINFFLPKFKLLT